MIFNCRFGLTAILLSAFIVSPFASAHPGQLFPPANIGANPNIPCPNGQLLGWHGDRVDCTNPTPGVTVSCPAGQFLTAITNGVPVCTPDNDTASVSRCHG